MSEQTARQTLQLLMTLRIMPCYNMLLTETIRGGEK